MRAGKQDAFAMTFYTDQRSVLLIADDAAARTSGEAAAQKAGLRICGSASILEGADRIDAQASLDVAWLALREAPTPAAERLLDRVCEGVRAGRFGAILVAPFDALDAVSRWAAHPRVELLCEPSSDDWTHAWQSVLAETSAVLHDIKNGHAPRLQELSEEVGRIAVILAALSDEERRHADAAPDTPAPLDAATIRAMIRLRRMRDQFFPEGLFADPAWDMLLDLMAARIEQRRVAVSSLCIAAAVPPTTALRWIKTMTEHGFFVRRADPQDGRRIYIELSDDAAARCESYLRAAQRVGPLAV